MGICYTGHARSTCGHRYIKYHNEISISSNRSINGYKLGDNVGGGRLGGSEMAPEIMGPTDDSCSVMVSAQIIVKQRAAELTKGT